MTDSTQSNPEEALAQAKTALISAAKVVSAMDVGDERSHQVRLIATLLLGQPEELRRSAVAICPDIEFAKPIPDTDLNGEELGATSALTASDVSIIDDAIVLNTTSSWQSVVRVIGYTIVDLRSQIPNVPLGFYAKRVKHLTSAGLIQSDGDLDFVRLSKIRLPNSSENAA
jgi:hypothetical protein